MGVSRLAMIAATGPTTASLRLSYRSERSRLSIVVYPGVLLAS